MRQQYTKRIEAGKINFVSKLLITQKQRLFSPAVMVKWSVGVEVAVKGGMLKTCWIKW